MVSSFTGQLLDASSGVYTLNLKRLGALEPARGRRT